MVQKTFLEYIGFLLLILLLVYFSSQILESFDNSQINFQDLIDGIEKIHNQSLNLFSFRNEYKMPKFDALLLGRLAEKRAEKKDKLIKEDVEEVMKDFDEYVLSTSFKKE